LYVRGSIREFTHEFRSLSTEIGIKLIAIDEDFNVECADL